MINPIRPVGLSVVPGCRALFEVRLHLLCALARCRTPVLGRLGLSIDPACRSITGGAFIAPARDARFDGWVCAAPPVEPWRPWPAHAPFADEIDRWWPGNEWPPREPAVVIVYQLPARPAEVIDWRAIGGLLDTRV